MSPSRSGFTLIELLLVIANIGVLAGIVIMAINPSQQVTAAQDARRSANIRALEGAIEQYYLDEGSYPGDDPIPYGYDSRVNICQNGATGTGCIQLDIIVTDSRNYLGAPEIPNDPSNTNPTVTGYSVYLDELSRPRVVSEYAGASGSKEQESGDFVGGTGSPADPYLIANCTQLQNFGDMTINTYADQDFASMKLVNDIDCSDTINWNGGAGFEPLYNFGDLWAGTLDGQGYSIRNLYINRPTEDTTALFEFIDSGTIKNVALINANITGKSQVAGFGARADGYYQNVYVTGTITGEDRVGAIASDIGSLGCQNCYSTATVTATAGKAGGLGGSLAVGTISNSFATGEVYATGNAGGIVGTNTTGTMSNVYWFDNNGDDAISCYSGGNTGCTEINAGNGGISYFYNSSNPPLSSWNFSSVWRENGATFPTLR